MTSLQVQSDPRMSGTEFASRAVDRLSGFISAALWVWLITFPPVRALPGLLRVCSSVLQNYVNKDRHGPRCNQLGSRIGFLFRSEFCNAQKGWAELALALKCMMLSRQSQPRPDSAEREVWWTSSHWVTSSFKAWNIQWQQWYESRCPVDRCPIHKGFQLQPVLQVSWVWSWSQATLVEVEREASKSCQIQRQKLCTSISAACGGKRGYERTYFPTKMQKSRNSAGSWTSAHHLWCCKLSQTFFFGQVRLLCRQDQYCLLSYLLSYAVLLLSRDVSGAQRSLPELFMLYQSFDHQWWDRN